MKLDILKIESAPGRLLQMEGGAQFIFCPQCKSFQHFGSTIDDKGSVSREKLVTTHHPLLKDGKPVMMAGKAAKTRKTDKVIEPVPLHCGAVGCGATFTIFQGEIQVLEGET